MKYLKDNKEELGLIIGLLGLLPLLWMQASFLWERPHLQFFPIGWLGLLFLVFTRTKVATTDNSYRRFAAGVLAIAALCLGVLGAYRISPWLGQVSGILLITSWGLLRLATTRWTRWVSWTLLLWITVPLPLGYDAELIQRLQNISTESAASILDLVGTAHLRQGNLIELRTGKLFVDQACSGVDSLYSLAAIALLIVVLQQRPFFVGLLTLISVPAWAWLGNVLRLSLIAWLLDTHGINLSEGTPHTILGMVIFGVSSLCLYLTLGMLTQAFSPFLSASLPSDSQWHLIYNAFVNWPDRALTASTGYNTVNDYRRVKSTGIPSKPEIAASTGDPRRFGVGAIALGAAFAICGALSSRAMFREEAAGVELALPHFDRSQVDKVAYAEAMPSTLGVAVQAGFNRQERERDSAFGEYSRFWTYRLGSTECLISLDFPFRGFHPLWVCYQSNGQTIYSDPQISKVESDGIEWKIATIELRDDLGNPSYVWFTMFDTTGKPIELSKYSLKVSESLVNRLGFAAANVDSSVDPVTFQCQLYVQTGEVLSDEKRKAFQDLLLKALPHAVNVARDIAKDSN